MLRYFKELFAWFTLGLVAYTTTVANNRLTQVATALNVSGGGDLVIGTAGMATTLVSVPLEAVIGAPVNKVLTVIATAKQGTAVAAGTAAAAKLVDGAGADVATGLTVGTSAADVILNDVVLLVGSQVTINTGTLTTP